jgi:phosphopantothenoylcysteine decarboxylase / phosphopantothenate---cysteine ligase
MLHGKKILIGVCGSIAAYKIAILIRLLKKTGCRGENDHDHLCS